MEFLEYLNQEYSNSSELEFLKFLEAEEFDSAGKEESSTFNSESCDSDSDSAVDDSLTFNDGNRDCSSNKTSQVNNKNDKNRDKSDIGMKNYAMNIPVKLSVCFCNIIILVITRLTSQYKFHVAKLLQRFLSFW